MGTRLTALQGRTEERFERGSVERYRARLATKNVPTVALDLPLAAHTTRPVKWSQTTVR